ncbi:hypothetical protein [Paenibacillus curdlanolyticus]|uniref:hypothetical protein n=1 Tax=Paenibacillus curdlanolyticus TaxID=59840 RepID=UPI0002D5F17E|nr:hypothetical protein [Paenibacillus curdlanolyticus]
MSDLSLDNVMLQIDYEEGHGHLHLGYRIHEVRVPDVPADCGDAFVLADWRKFMSNGIRFHGGNKRMSKDRKNPSDEIWRVFRFFSCHNIQTSLVLYANAQRGSGFG